MSEMSDVLVYQLRDPRDGVIFYVGKGKKGRPQQHLRRALAGDDQDNPFKHERILAIVADGLKPTVEIVASYATDEEAVDHEARLIESMPGLTNILARGWALSPEAQKRRDDKEMRVYWLKHPKRLLAMWRQWVALQTLPNFQWDATPPGTKLHTDLVAGMDKFFADAYRVLSGEKNGLRA